MNPLDRADAYLTIPRGYGEALGGLWWSSRRDAVERRDGTTLALADEVRAVLEGVLARPPVAPFAFVLNLLHLMKAVGGPQAFGPLREAFAQTRGVAGRGRNVGLLIAELCRGLPGAAGRVDRADVTQALYHRRVIGELSRPDQWEEPPLTRAEFERRVAQRLEGFTPAALAHLLTRGSAPGTAGERLAEEVQSLPERVARLLALARRRARLAGAAALVPALDAALALPPRRRSPDSVPQGGYCDVTTRGDPERLLPGQFALDPDEFVRRFAANELLYFKREEPHEAVRPERVIVLDQGVRTWGGVRHALAAAAFSLLRRDVKRCARVRLFATSAPGAVDLAERDADSVADLLEASDLTPHPNECLVRALHDPDSGPAPRDVILLTHPRTVREPATYHGGTRRPNDRVFALSVDERGRTELSEWAGGGLIPLRSFRVDLEAAEAARPEGQPARPRADAGSAWEGDVEPVVFPFRPGLVASPLGFGFDADGRWLVAAGHYGVLHGMELDGSPPEVLPRPYRDGAVLREVDAILGVIGGAVVCGRMALGGTVTVTGPDNLSATTYAPGVPVVESGASFPPPVEQFAAAHYDRASRRVTLHLLGAACGGAQWTAHPDLHCVAVRTQAGGGRAVDLATEAQFPGWLETGLVSRARAAWDRSAKGGAGPQSLPLLTRDSVPEYPGGRPYLYRLDDSLRVKQAAPWAAFTPRRDGKPLLAGAYIRRAELAGDVLAVELADAGERKLVLFRGPEGAVLGEVTHPVRTAFALSGDGRLLARRDAARAAVVSETATPARPLASAAHAGLHDALSAQLDADPFRLTVVIGAYRHTFRVNERQLLYTPRWEPPGEEVQGPKGRFAHPPTAYDLVRFPPGEVAHCPGWRAVVDRLGQVLLFTTAGRLVAAFAVRRERAAAWTPGGVFWGDARLIGGPPTPGAGAKIGQAILAAGGT